LPPTGAVTGTVITQPLVGIDDPLGIVIEFAVVVGVIPQLLVALVTVVSPVGSVSVKSEEVVTAAPVVFLIVSVSVEGSPAGIVDEEKDLPMVIPLAKTEPTEAVAPSGLEPTFVCNAPGGIVFVNVPTEPASKATNTVTTHDSPGSIDAPDIVMVLEPVTAVTITPGPQSTGVPNKPLTIIPAGKVSTKGIV
jgi:hypothetical protein